MSKSTRRQAANRLARNLTDLARHLPKAETAWEDLAPGVKAQDYSPPMATYRPPLEGQEDAGPRVADPTGEAAIAGTPSQRDEHELDRLLADAAALVDKAHKIVKRWAVDGPLEVAELAELERQAEPGCEIVGAISRGKGLPNYWEATYIASTDVGGILERPYRLGVWAQRFIRDHGRKPTTAETTAHCEGRTVMVKA